MLGQYGAWLGLDEMCFLLPPLRHLLGAQLCLTVLVDSHWIGVEAICRSTMWYLHYVGASKPIADQLAEPLLALLPPAPDPQAYPPAHRQRGSCLSAAGRSCYAGIKSPASGSSFCPPRLMSSWSEGPSSPTAHYMPSTSIFAIPSTTSCWTLSCGSSASALSSTSRSSHRPPPWLWGGQGCPTPPAAYWPSRSPSP